MLTEKWDRRGPEVSPRNNLNWSGAVEFCDETVVHPVVRAVDFHERDRAHVIESLRSSLEGVQTRAERFGEIRGRLIRGMWRKPQHVIDVRDPKQIPSNKLTDDMLHNWELVFSNDLGSTWWGKSNHPSVFLIMDAPGVKTYVHKPAKAEKEQRTRTEIPGKADPAIHRRVVAVCVRESSISSEICTALREIAQQKGYPFYELDSFFNSAHGASKREKIPV